MKHSPKHHSQSRAWKLARLVPAIILLGGCVVEEGPRGHRNVYVEPAPPLAGETVVVEAPPPLREEIIIARPSPAHVWIRGYWAWREGRHVWLAGHWELPPQPGSVWIEPRWEHRDRGYVFIAGAWRSGPGVVVERAGVAPTVSVRMNFIAQPPPPPRHEVVVERERPSSAHVWINGYWVWRDGRHVWTAGHWERPPHPHAVWVEPRWEHRREGYVFVEGCWR